MPPYRHSKSLLHRDNSNKRGPYNHPPSTAKQWHTDSSNNRFGSITASNVIAFKHLHYPAYANKLIHRKKLQAQVSRDNTAYANRSALWGNGTPLSLDTVQAPHDQLPTLNWQQREDLTVVYTGGQAKHCGAYIQCMQQEEEYSLYVSNAQVVNSIWLECTGFVEQPVYTQYKKMISEYYYVQYDAHTTGVIEWRTGENKDFLEKSRLDRKCWRLLWGCLYAWHSTGGSLPKRGRLWRMINDTTQNELELFLQTYNRTCQCPVLLLGVPRCNLPSSEWESPNSQLVVNIGESNSKLMQVAACDTTVPFSTYMPNYPLHGGKSTETQLPLVVAALRDSWQENVKCVQTAISALQRGGVLILHYPIPIQEAMVHLLNLLRGYFSRLTFCKTWNMSLDSACCVFWYFKDPFDQDRAILAQFLELSHQLHEKEFEDKTQNLQEKIPMTFMKLVREWNTTCMQRVVSDLKSMTQLFSDHMFLNTLNSYRLQLTYNKKNLTSQCNTHVGVDQRTHRKVIQLVKYARKQTRPEDYTHTKDKNDIDACLQNYYDTDCHRMHRVYTDISEFESLPYFSMVKCTPDVYNLFLVIRNCLPTVSTYNYRSRVDNRDSTQKSRKLNYKAQWHRKSIKEWLKVHTQCQCIASARSTPYTCLILPPSVDEPELYLVLNPIPHSSSSSREQYITGTTQPTESIMLSLYAPHNHGALFAVARNYKIPVLLGCFALANITDEALLPPNTTNYQLNLCMNNFWTPLVLSTSAMTCSSSQSLWAITTTRPEGVCIITTGPGVAGECCYVTC
jgi:hypothetical protein